MNRKFILISVIVLIAVNVALFFKMTSFEFVNYDDVDYVMNNPFIKDVNASKVKMMFTTPYFSNYQPLVHVSYAVDYKLSTFDAGNYHVTNLIFHILNALLVFYLIHLITKCRWLAFVIALLFSLHPMQVETVAWISERKGLMCTFFYMLSFITYIYHSRSEKRSLYILSIALFAFSLMSKPMSVTLPVILLLFDYYEEKLSGSKLIEKIPYFVLAVIFSITTIIAQRKGGSMHVEKSKTFLLNITLAFNRIGFYIGKLILPVKLSAFYEYPKTSGYIVVAVLTVIALTAYAFFFKKIKRATNFGILFFLSSLIPILKVVHIEGAIGADRYMYVPMIGFFFALSIMINDAINKRPNLKKVMIALSCAYFIFLFTLSYKRLDVWKDGLTLWTSVLEAYPDSKIGAVGLGEAYMTRKDYDRAREYYSKTLDNNFYAEVGFFFIGKAYLYEKNNLIAKKYFTTLVEKFPNNAYNNNAKAYMYLGNISDEAGENEEADRYYEKALETDPYSSLIHYNVALTSEKRGDMKRAFKHYKLADKYDLAGWGLPKEALKRLAPSK